MKFKMTVLLVGLCIWLGGAISHADPTHPFPGGHTIAIPFPWDSINGVWEITDNRTATQFSFDVLADTNGNFLLHVVQFDQRTGAVLAEGIGYQSSTSQNTVSVMMQPKRGGPLFQVVLQSYQDQDTHKHVNVMTVFANPGQIGELKDFNVLKRVGPQTAF